MRKKGVVRILQLSRQDGAAEMSLVQLA